MKKLLIVCVVLFVLLICGLLVVNSGFFVKRVVLPVMASKIGADVTVADVEFSVFKGIQLVDFKVEGEGGRPAPLSAGVVRISYKFSPLLKGEVHVEEVLLENVSVHIVEDKDGRLNIPGSTRSEPASPQEEPVEKGAVIVPRFDIQNVAIKNVSLIYEREAADSSPEAAIAISGVTLSLDRLAPGEAFTLNSECSIVSTIGDRVNLHAQHCTLLSSGTIREDLFPSQLDVTFAMEKITGNAASVKLEGRTLAANIGCEGNGKNYTLTRCELSESYQEKIEGMLAVNGEISIDPMAANLDIQMNTEGAGALNLVGGIVGDYDFGETSLEYKANLKVQDNASVASCAGGLKVTGFTVSSQNLGISGLSPLDVTLDHNVSYDQSRQFVDLQELNMVVTEKSKQVVSLVLSEPTTISFQKGTASESTEATIKLAVTDFDLNFFKPLIPSSTGVDLAEGVLNKNAEITIRGGGDRVEITGTAVVDNMHIKAAGEDYSGLGLQNQYSLKCHKFFTELVVDHVKVATFVNGESAMELGMLGSFDLQNRTGIAEIRPFRVNPALSSLVPKKILDPFELNNLNCDANFEVMAIDDGKSITIRGRLGTNPIEIRNKASGSALSLAPELALNTSYATSGYLRISQGDIKLDNTQKSKGGISLEGGMDTKTLDGELKLNISAVDAPLLDEAARLFGLNFLFGDTRIDSECSIKLTNNGNDLSANGNLTARGVSVQSSQLETPPIRPLNFSSSFSGKLDVGKMLLNWDSFSFFAEDNESQVIAAELGQPAVVQLDSSRSSSPHEPAVINLTINNLHLDLFEPLIPEGLNVELTDAKLDSSVTVNIVDLARQITSTGNVVLAEISVPSQQTDAELPVPQSLATQLDYKIDFSDDDGMVRITKSSVSVAENEKSLIHLEAQGDFDAKFTGKPSVISVKSLAPIEAKRLENIALSIAGVSTGTPTQQDKNSPLDSPVSESSPESGTDGQDITSSAGTIGSGDGSTTEIPKLDVQLNVDIPELRYDQIVVTNCNPRISLRNNTVVIEPFTSTVNDGTLQAEVFCDYNDLNNLAYNGRLDVGGLDLQPVAASLVPEYRTFVSGQLKEATLSFDGKGTTANEIFKTLKSTVSCELLNLDAASFVQDYKEILRIFGIRTEHLLFNSVRVDSDIADNLVNLSELSLNNPTVRILSNGLMELGGNWLPNLEVVLGYSGDLAEWVQKKKMKVKESEDNFFYTEKIPLKLSSWKKTTVLKEWLPSAIDNVFDLDPRERAAMLGIQSVGGILSGETSVKDVIKSGVGIFGSLKKKDNENPNSTTEPNSPTDDEPPEESKEDMKSFLDFFNK